MLAVLEALDRMGLSIHEAHDQLLAPKNDRTYTDFRNVRMQINFFIFE